MDGRSEDRLFRSVARVDSEKILSALRWHIFSLS